MEKQRINIASRKDFDVSYFCGPGPGGQKKNKTHSGVQIIHRESGALGRASDSRSQADNKAKAFSRLLETPRWKLWLNRKLYEMDQKETMEETVERETGSQFLKHEIRNKAGQWEEVPASYFETAAAKNE